MATLGEGGKISGKKRRIEMRSMAEKTASEERRGVNRRMSGKVMEQINLYRHRS